MSTKITLVYMVFRDGRRDLLHTVVGHFDAAAWFESRRPALARFDVARVEVEALNVYDSHPSGRFPRESVDTHAQGL